MKLTPRPQIYALANAIDVRETIAERGLTERLCQELETPDNDDRWRALLGEDPDLEQLRAKLAALEVSTAGILPLKISY